MADLHEQSATSLARLIRTGEVSSREVVRAHLDRIEAVNGYLNAVTVVLGESALAAAEAADRALRTGTRVGPLHGVPFTVKENVDLVGSATTHGLRVLAEAMPYQDAPAVARLKAAGAIPIARTNLSEMGLRLDADNPLRGRTRNPWSARLTPGGSSGGDAAAVATGMTPIGLGTDIGGSLRVPASCCGVTTLKPTTGRFAHASSLSPEDHGAAGQVMLAPGPITRSLPDLRVCFAVLAGRDPRDPRSVDAPLVGPPLEQRRITLVTEVPGAAIAPEVRAGVERAGDLLAAAGWTVERGAPPELVRVGELWHKLLATDLAVVLPLIQPHLSPALFDHVTRFCQTARLEDASNHRLHQERSRLQRAWSGFFAESPAVVGPALAGAPWPIDADLDPEIGLDLLMEATRFILPANALGLPVVGLPVRLPDRLPTGLQVYADLWREDLCLEVAETIEQGLGANPVIDPRS